MIGRRKRAKGLSVGTPAEAPVGFLSVPLERASLPEVDACCRRLAGAGAGLIVIAGAGPVGGRQWVELVDAIGGMTAIATRHGLRLAIYPGLELERFLVNTEAGLCLDVDRLREAGIDPLDLIETAAGRIRHVHMRRPAPELVEALRRHGYRGWVTVEPET